MKNLDMSYRIKILLFSLFSVLVLNACNIVPNPESELSIFLYSVNGVEVNNAAAVEVFSGEKLSLTFNLTASEGIRRFEVIPNNIFNADFKENGVDLVRKTIVAEFSIPSSATGKQVLDFRLEDFEGNRKEAQVLVSFKQKQTAPTGPPIFPFGR